MKWLGNLNTPHNFGGVDITVFGHPRMAQGIAQFATYINGQIVVLDDVFLVFGPAYGSSYGSSAPRTLNIEPGDLVDLALVAQ